MNKLRLLQQRTRSEQRAPIPPSLQEKLIQRQKRDLIIQSIHKRNKLRKAQTVQLGSKIIQQNYWELALVNQFLHQVYLKYKYREYRQLKKGKSLEHIIFICRFIGRFKLLAWRIKCRVVAKKIMFRIKRYLHGFRMRRKIRLERDLLASVQNFQRITKIFQAGRILIERILKI